MIDIYVTYQQVELYLFENIIVKPYKTLLFYMVIRLDMNKRVQCKKLLVRSYVKLASKNVS